MSRLKKGTIVHPENAARQAEVAERPACTPLNVRSAYRSPEHNRAVGGATRSKHLDGAAFDISMANRDPVAFEAAAREVGFFGFGLYPRSGFIHVDLGHAQQWGERFPVRHDVVRQVPPGEVALGNWIAGGTGKGIVHPIASGTYVVQRDVEPFSDVRWKLEGLLS